MSKAKLTLEDAHAIAAAILSRAQLTPSVAKTSDAPTRKRGRPAKLKTAEELEHDADAVGQFVLAQTLLAAECANTLTELVGVV